MRIAVAAIFLMAAEPAMAGLADETEYIGRATRWALLVGVVDACEKTYSAGLIEAEADSAAELLRPGMINWISGDQAEAGRLAFAAMWSAYDGAKAEDCTLSKARLDLARSLLDFTREDLARR